MIKGNIIILLCVCLMFSAFAQEALTHKDYLTKEFHRERREKVRQKLPDNSVAVFFANPVRNRANDVDYPYHQDPDFYYLTGFQEPDALLLIFSEDQEDGNGAPFNEVLFVRGHHKREELYNGPRLGVEGAKEKLGFNRVYENTAFTDFPLEFSDFTKILFFEFHNDIRDKRGKTGDLFNLVEQLKQKISYPRDFNPYRAGIHEAIKNVPSAEREVLAERIQYLVGRYPELGQDRIIRDFMQGGTPVEEQKLTGGLSSSPSNLDALSLGTIMADLREIKTEEEIELLRKAINISSIGQIEVMKAMHPGMSEAEIQGVHEFVFKKYGARYEGYPSIVGAGHNGCVLHYIQNDKPRVGDDLVLMDLGAEFQNYTADVTRTVPAGGKFSTEQKAIYDLVFKAQEEAFKVCKPGVPIRRTTEVCREVIADGLIKLGIISDASAVTDYFPHGVTHHIGLDVHDRGNYNTFQENMILTVEPGIYIPENSRCDKKWWGIAVRIEDDILITGDSYELLSDLAPRTTEEIEQLMAEESVLNEFSLPALE